MRKPKFFLLREEHPMKGEPGRTARTEGIVLARSGSEAWNLFEREVVAAFGPETDILSMRPDKRQLMVHPATIVEIAIEVLRGAGADDELLAKVDKAREAIEA